MPRGRPKKNPETPVVEEVKKEEVQVVKQGRGRPKKVLTSEEIAKQEEIIKKMNEVEEKKVLNDKKLCIIVDMQNDFITGSLANKSAEKIVGPMCEFIKNYDGHIIFTQDTHDDKYLESMEGKKLPIIHCVEGTDGWQIHKKLVKTIKDEKRDLKTAYKFYFGVGETLKNRIENEIKEAPDVIDIMGVCTDICVVSVALELKTLYPDTEFNLHSHLCAGTTPKKHQAAVDVMESCQFNIIKNQ